jgi:hypothetical protein
MTAAATAPAEATTVPAASRVGSTVAEPRTASSRSPSLREETKAVLGAPGSSSSSSTRS